MSRRPFLRRDSVTQSIERGRLGLVRGVVLEGGLMQKLRRPANVRHSLLVEDQSVIRACAPTDHSTSQLRVSLRDSDEDDDDDDDEDSLFS